MPYSWITLPAQQHDAGAQPNTPAAAELHLWPHQSLRPIGYAWFLWVTAALITLPLLPLLGTFALWALLPFLLLALFGLKWALDRNRRDAQILEVLSLDANEARLIHRDAKGAEQSWHCNRYWVSVELHASDGPLPNYVTLRGGGREVEIGAFLSEEERKALYQELTRVFSTP